MQTGGKELGVTLTGQFANKTSTWRGRVVRTEGVIDVNSRILYVVAELKGEELYSLEDRTPITIGQFVSAEIEGRAFENVVKLPRESLRQGNQVLVVDQDNKLRTRMVNVLEANSEFVVISSGVNDGDIVNMSQLGISVDGLLVETDPIVQTSSSEMVASSGAANIQETTND